MLLCVCVCVCVCVYVFNSLSLCLSLEYTLVKKKKDWLLLSSMAHASDTRTPWWVFIYTTLDTGVQQQIHSAAGTSGSSARRAWRCDGHAQRAALAELRAGGLALSSFLAQWSDYSKELPGQFIRIRLKIEKRCQFVWEFFLMWKCMFSSFFYCLFPGSRCMPGV